MAENTIKNLKFLERQFKSIKELIPISNHYLSQASLPEKLIKKYFLTHSSFWDTLQSKENHQLYRIHLTEEDEKFISHRILAILELLVKIKRISKEAKNSQQSLKITLYELMLRLRDQVMTPVPTDELIPSFTQVQFTNKNLQVFWGIFGKKKSIKKKVGKDYEKIMTSLINAEIPEFTSRVLQEQYTHLYHLTQIGKDQESALLEALQKYERLKNRAVKGKREYEAKAYEVIGNMVLVEKELNEVLRKQTFPVYENLITDIKGIIKK
ncbi:MAG: hypothetical protein KDD63_26865 [Bacteroidetes bacterium]|nr:hypothetical protein [Bacteroidota bacterium]